MKVYKVNRATKFFVIFIIILWQAMALFIFFNDGKITLSFTLLYILTTLFCFLALGSLFNFKVLIDSEKIELIRASKFGKRKTIIFWKDVKMLDSGYLLYPEINGWIILISKNGSLKNELHIPFTILSIQIVKDILSHLPKGIEINLYHYLKRKIEGKQTFFYK